MGTHPKRSVSATSVPRHTSNWSFSVTGEQRQISFQDKDTQKRTISKKTRASATEIMQWQEPARHGQPPQKRGARVRRCRVRDAGRRSEEERRSEGAKERRSEGAKERRGADAGVSAGAKVHGVRRVSVQVQVQVQARARARGVGRGVRRVPMRGSEKCRCRAQKSVGVSRVQAQVQARGQKDVKGEGGGKTNRRGAQKSVGTGAGAGADRTGPSGQRLRTRRPRRRARPTV